MLMSLDRRKTTDKFLDSNKAISKNLNPSATPFEVGTSTLNVILGVPLISSPVSSNNPENISKEVILCVHNRINLASVYKFNLKWGHSDSSPSKFPVPMFTVHIFIVFSSILAFSIMYFLDRIPLNMLNGAVSIHNLTQHTNLLNATITSFHPDNLNTPVLSQYNDIVNTISIHYDNFDESLLLCSSPSAHNRTTPVLSQFSMTDGTYSVDYGNFNEILLSNATPNVQNITTPNVQNITTLFHLKIAWIVLMESLCASLHCLIREMIFLLM